MPVVIEDITDQEREKELKAAAEKAKLEAEEAARVARQSSEAGAEAINSPPEELSAEDAEAIREVRAIASMNWVSIFLRLLGEC